MTGKAMVPIVSRQGGWTLRLQDQDYVLSTEDEVKAMEKRIADRGYYPIRLTDDEVAAWETRPGARRYPVQSRDGRHGRALDGARR